MTTDTTVATDIADKTLETVLINIIDKVTSGVDKAIEFGSEQLPDIVKQLILFNTVKLTFICLFSALIVYGYYRVCVKISKAERGDFWYHNDLPGIPFVVFGFVLALVSVIGLYKNMVELLQITIAPKIWLIEYAAGLVK